MYILSFSLISHTHTHKKKHTHIQSHEHIESNLSPLHIYLILCITTVIFSILWWCFSMGWKYGMVTPLSLCKKCLKMSKRSFLRKFSKWRNKGHTPSYFLRWDHFHLRYWLCKGLLDTCISFKNVCDFNFLESYEKHATLSKRHIKTLDARYKKLVLKIECNTLASWCINRFLCEWDLFAMPTYHGMGKMWMLVML